jgi:hypothetical protein
MVVLRTYLMDLNKFAVSASSGKASDLLSDWTLIAVTGFLWNSSFIPGTWQDSD